MVMRSWIVPLHLAAWLLLLLVDCPPPTVAAANKDSCGTCRKLVDRFHKGLKDTAKNNFGGGNTAWEEKTLSKYESSEIRLVEIIENLCDSSDFECNQMLEEHEEQVEKWWFKMRKKYPDLLKWFCIDTIEVCCPSGTYGPDCLACLGGSERPCHGNGLCSGDGTRSGDGSCRCNVEYTGPFCLECADGYFSSERNDTHSVCTACHPACKTCHGPSNKDCKDCKDGWTKQDESCVDVDECGAEESPCKEDKYCLNTEGSYSCKACDRSCIGCTGEGPENCKNCTSGYVLQDSKCTDINECDGEEKVCLRDNENCTNTPGSYTCSCADGFEDKDGECVEVVKKACDRSCIGCTGEGPENCKNCTSGYVLQDSKCTDINECDGEEKVCLRDNENCTNTPGSYTCSCADGFEDKDGECVEVVKKGDAEDENEAATSGEDKDSANVHEDL